MTDVETSRVVENNEQINVTYGVPVALFGDIRKQLSVLEGKGTTWEVIDSAIGKQREFVLPDGGKVTLNCEVYEDADASGSIAPLGAKLVKELTPDGIVLVTAFPFLTDLSGKDLEEKPVVLEITFPSLSESTKVEGALSEWDVISYRTSPDKHFEKKNLVWPSNPDILAAAQITFRKQIPSRRP